MTILCPHCGEPIEVLDAVYAKARASAEEHDEKYRKVDEQDKKKQGAQ